MWFIASELFYLARLFERTKRSNGNQESNKFVENVKYEKRCSSVSINSIVS